MHYLGREIKKTQNLIDRLMKSTTRLNPEDESPFSVKQNCWYLYRNLDKTIYQKDLEKVFSLRRSSASAQLKKMEDMGLILREEVDSDKRLKKISLTASAKDKVEKTISEIILTEEIISSGLSEEEAETLCVLLGKIRQTVDENLAKKQDGSACNGKNKKCE